MIGRGGFCNTLAYQRGELSPPPVPTPDPFESKKRKPTPSLALAGEPGTPAYGTIRGRSPMRVVRWELAALRDLVASDADLERRLGARDGPR